MASIGVLHSDLSTYGGGEVVCMHVLKSLERSHDIEVITSTPSVNLNSLAAFTGVPKPDVKVKSVNSIVSLIHQQRGERFSLVEIAAFNRMARRLCDDYDLVVSTMNELALPNNGVQYIHVPQFNRSSVPGEPDSNNFILNIYNRICRAIAGWSKEEIADSTLLTNSDWTGNVTRDIYGVQPKTVYPPVDVEAFSPKPWADRENGFVSVGRIEPPKNILDLIQIVDVIQERGFDYHYHIVGDHNNDGYWKQISDAVDQRPYVSYEGTIERSQLIAFLENHKFGLHGRKYEHFGMAVAEMATAGMVPFIPNSGGQVEIVGNSDHVTYSSVSEAVQNVCAILSGEISPDTIRDSFVDPEKELSIDRFYQTISAAVDQELD